MKGLLVTVLGVALLAACGEEKAAPPPESKGLPCELLVVCGPEVQGGDLMDSVKTITESDAPGLGSGENIFRVTNIGTSGYLPAFWTLHSKVFFEVNPKLREPRIGVLRDVKAAPQIELHVEAPSVESMRAFLSEKRTSIQQALLEFQVQRLKGLVEKKYSRKVSRDLRKVAGYTVQMPAEMVATKQRENFLWGSSNRNQRDINFLFYTYPWEGEDISDVERYVQRRDSVLKANIPGSKPQQWMTTSRGQEGQPVVWPRMRRVNGEVVLEVRGLWELQGGFMGGPFVALVGVDTVARRVIVREGFVYNPEGQKRDLMRQLEGALRTLKKIPKGQTPAEEGALDETSSIPEPA